MSMGSTTDDQGDEFEDEVEEHNLNAGRQGERGDLVL
jgi:hypothetical protein